jgi:hypothetical protein
MSAFYTSRPAILHDQLNDRMIAWNPKSAEHWRKYAELHGEGVISWDGRLIDGWKPTEEEEEQ